MNRELKAKIVLHYGCQADASAKMGISEPRLSRIINGRVQARPDEAKMLREKLGVTLQEETAK